MLPALITEIPGPQSLALAKELKLYESRNVTYVSEDWPVFWERAEGVNVWDTDGNRFLDLTAAFGVAGLGHGWSAGVMREQAEQLIHGMGDVHPTRLKVDVCKKLSELSFERWGAGVGKTILSNSGFEAVESALKTAKIATGKAGVVSFKNSYHGMGYGALLASGFKKFRQPFEDQLAPMREVLDFPASRDDLESLSAQLEKLDGDQLGVVLVEPIQGRGGKIVPPDGFLALLRTWCDQIGKSNQHLLTKIFNIFYLSINFGSVIASLCIPLILKWYGPHWAFGIPGVLMCLATLMFWSGRNKFIHVPPHGKAFYTELKSQEGRTAIAKLIPLFLFVAIFWCLFDQTASTLVFQAEKMDLHLFGPGSFTVLPSQIQAANPFLILILIPIFTWGIYPALSKVITLTPLRKIGTGLFLMVIAFGVLSLVQEAIDRGETPSVWWQLLAYVILTVGEVLVSIVCLEFAYTQAPRKMKSFVMSLFLLSVFAGNLITGAINLYIDVPTIALSEKKPSHPGFDGKSGTDDDLSLKNGEINSPAHPLLSESAAAIANIYQHKKSLPTTDDGAKALANFKDPWGNPLRYTQISATTARISSDGPDKEHLTKWDLGALVKVNKKDKVNKDTWLYKEKVKKGMIDAPTKGSASDSLVKITYYAGGQTKLEGAAYFWFFTILMLITSIIFIPFALTYKTKTYLQQ